VGALSSNTTGVVENTTNGGWALYSNILSNFNTANGQKALYSNNGGFQNIACWQEALHDNITGGNNIALRLQAGYSANRILIQILRRQGWDVL